jgi:predicted RNA-binding protein with PIN domain
MYEQDIELARLLLERLTELDKRAESLHAELDETRKELQNIATVRDERAQYMDILSRAARLLERPDLEVESPQSSELESRETELLAHIDELHREALVYRELSSELSQRAPHLLSAAQGDAVPAEALALAAAAEAAADEPAPALEQEAVQAPEEDAAESPFGAGMSADDDPALILGRFNINNLKTKESFTFGRGAAYVVDGTSVLERVPHYDTHFRAMKETAARDELIRDIDVLSRELSGSFHVVFSSWHQPAIATSHDVGVEYGTGEGEGTKLAGNRRLRELASELGGQERSVCVVTGDTALADSLRGPGVHIISLGEFFKT